MHRIKKIYIHIFWYPDFNDDVNKYCNKYRVDIIIPGQAESDFVSFQIYTDVKKKRY